jgi:hypothetical protein
VTLIVTPPEAPVTEAFPETLEGEVGVDEAGVDGILDIVVVPFTEVAVTVLAVTVVEANTSV